MADPIYGIHQSQPRDIYDYMKANARPLGLEGRFSYLPTLKEKAENNRIIGINDGVEMIVSDEILYEDEVLMDGRTRRYSKIKIFLAAFGARNRSTLSSIEDEMRQLGYNSLTITNQLDVATEFSAALGINVNSPYYNPLLLTAADLVEIRAGVPRYFNSESSIVDAPSDGQRYVRVNSEWVLSDSAATGVIDGGTATINGGGEAPAGVTFPYTPDYVFDGTSYNNSYENYSEGEEPYTTHGIDQISISDTFLTINFVNASSRTTWQSQDRQVSINNASGDYEWEGTYTLSAATAYSVNVQFDYIHYQLSLSSTQKAAMADFIASAGTGSSVVSMEIN